MISVWWHRCKYNDRINQPINKNGHENDSQVVAHGVQDSNKKLATQQTSIMQLNCHKQAKICLVI